MSRIQFKLGLHLTFFGAHTRADDEVEGEKEDYVDCYYDCKTTQYDIKLCIGISIKTSKNQSVQFINEGSNHHKVLPSPIN